MIRLFLLIAVAIHATALMWQIDRSAQKLSIVAPALSITLVNSSADNIGKASITKNIENINTAALAQRTSVERLNDSNNPTSQIRELQSVSTLSAESSHLVALLRAAIQERFIYPPIARKNGWQGRVVIGLTVSNIGKFRNIHLVGRSPYPILNTSAVDTLKRIGAIPAMQAYLPNRGQYLMVPINYRLTEEI